MYGNTSESQAASYDRDHPLYPYKSHGQWLKGCYGLVGCVVLILFNGVGAFIEPFNIRKFVSAYISVGSYLFAMPPRPSPYKSFTCFYADHVCNCAVTYVLASHPGLQSSQAWAALLGLVDGQVRRSEQHRASDQSEAEGKARVPGQWSHKGKRLHLPRVDLGVDKVDGPGGLFDVGVFVPCFYRFVAMSCFLSFLSTSIPIARCKYTFLGVSCASMTCN